MTASSDRDAEGGALIFSPERFTDHCSQKWKSFQELFSTESNDNYIPTSSMVWKGTDSLLYCLGVAEQEQINLKNSGFPFQRAPHTLAAQDSSWKVYRLTQEGQESVFCLHKISMVGKYHCPCVADVQGEGCRSPLVVSKAREGKQKPSQVWPSWGPMLPPTMARLSLVLSLTWPLPWGLHISTLALTLIDGCLVWMSSSGRSRPSSLQFARQLLESKTEKLLFKLTF